MRARRSAVAASMAVMALLASGCGVPDDGAPRLITGQALEPTTTTPPTTAPNVSAAPIYLFNERLGDSGRLVPATRNMPDPSANRRLEALLVAQPTPEEVAANLTNKIPLETKLLSPPSLDANGVMTIDLSKDMLTTITGNARTVAFAQLVYTVTELPDVSSVTFRVEGQPVDVADQTGEARTTPLDRMDFNDYQPLARPSTTSTSAPSALLTEIGEP